MYKYLLFRVFVMLTLVGVFSSCSQDDSDVENLADNHAQPIEFTLDVTSRGAETTLKNLESIYVYGYYTDADGEVQQCFDDATYENGIVEFKKSSEGYYKPETPIYWGKSWGETVTFLAFNPLTAEKSVYSDLGEFKTLTVNKSDNNNLKVLIQPSYCVRDHFDFITAKATTTKNESRLGIPLTFNHQLSQVELKFKISENSDYSIDVYGAGLQRNNINRIGTYDFADGAIVNRNINGAGSFWFNTRGMTVGTVAQSVNESYGSAFVVPENCPAYSSPESGKFIFPDNTGVQYISLYAKVYDAEHNKLIYPTNDDLKYTTRYLSVLGKVANYYEPDLPTSEIGYSLIPIHTAIDYKPGYKYVITVDLTDGIGYFSGNDPEKPGESVLNPSLSAKVQVTEYKIGDDIPEVSE